VLFAVGRRALTKELCVESAGVKTVPESGKIFAENEQTNVKHIFAVGDVLHVSVLLAVIHSSFCSLPSFIREPG
jgi:pyruvate/2-oxoglutarate dehydrogenase complex dihydrolipoamide dehydrogenase (E3) component